MKKWDNTSEFYKIDIVANEINVVLKFLELGMKILHFI